MFELAVALKYLIPRKRQLSVSLISLMSIVVISLVVWLLLVFLSVTEGIERNWLGKLTTLNAPLRITPTKQYYDSFYYRIDALSNSSEFQTKNIAQKLHAAASNPYNLIEDEELPLHFPSADLNADGTLKDPVKTLYSLLGKLKTQRSDLVFQDFELSGAMMRLQMLRPGSFPHSEDNQSYLTQVSYLATFPEQCPHLSTLLVPPTSKDINHLLYLAGHSTENSRQDAPALTLKSPPQLKNERVQELLQKIAIGQLKPKHHLWQLPTDLIPEKKTFQAVAVFRNQQLSQLIIPALGLDKSPHAFGSNGKAWKEGGRWIFESKEGTRNSFPLSIPILTDDQAVLKVSAPAQVDALGNLIFAVRTSIQNVEMQGLVNGDGLEIAEARFKHNREAPLSLENETGVYLAKNYQDSGVLLGDRGYLSYSSATASSLQEHRLPIFVAGFYDPGILPVGNKCILVPPHVPETINASSSSYNLDRTESNGFLVWFDDLNQAEQVQKELQQELALAGVDGYWKIKTFKEYDFAKDLMEQFQSDKYLFTLVGIIILVVACCNIISLLVLLVNDKKKEIGILQAMGASRKSIALIFGTCGICMGILSSLIGIAAAIATLKNIDSIAQMLSFIQGHDAFNTTFFGKTLPGTLSNNAVLFILIATPLLSLLAGFIPALKACRLRPSEILRSE
ncbi:MAG: FtsX-like permease family protein [Chlamydiota bacterium]